MPVFGMPTLIEAPGPEAAVRLCKELGLQFVELNMNLPEYQPHQFPMAELKKLADETGVFYTIHVDENLNPCDFNPYVADAWLRTMEETLGIARELGAPVVNMHLSRGVYFTLPGQRVFLYEEYLEEYLAAILRLRETCEKAAGGQVRICIENTDGFLSVQKQAIQLLLESPVFGLTYDIGHDYGANYVDRPFLLEHSDRLCHMHLHDAGEKGIHLALGDGQLPLTNRLHLAEDHDCRIVLETKTLSGLKKSVDWLHRCYLPTQDELFFWQQNPTGLQIYQSLKATLLAMHPGTQFSVKKTQISLQNRYVFGAVSLPRKKSQPGLLLTLGLPTPMESPRICQRVEAYPGRWTHHITMFSPDDLDDELLRWLEAAVVFAQNK
ncbi:MAG: sugar phosphate isomerase/epimerase [Clostridia bacterium]|nr:sugar phosphate isomerase/epimerase [Clostridia bacterium]